MELNRFIFDIFVLVFTERVNKHDMNKRNHLIDTPVPRHPKSIAFKVLQKIPVEKGLANCYLRKYTFKRFRSHGIHLSFYAQVSPIQKQKLINNLNRQMDCDTRKPLTKVKTAIIENKLIHEFIVYSTFYRHLYFICNLLNKYLKQE